MDPSTEPLLLAEGLEHQGDRIEPGGASKSLPSGTPESRGDFPEPSFSRRILDRIYTPPRQRLGGVSSSTLDEHDETLEWEQIFLDLFYIPAISSLSEMLLGILASGHVEEDGDELVYQTHGYTCFFAVFFSIWSTWYHNTVCVSKFVANSKFHQLMNRMRLLLVAIAIFHITEAREMEEIASESSFYYCLGITLECALTIIGRIELMLQGNARMRDDSAAVLCFVYVPRFALYAAAWLCQIQDRPQNWPVLVLCGALIPSVLAVACEYFFTMVPIDQHKYNERIGAWVSVLLGEEVIALLSSNVDNTSDERWITFIIGLMTVMVIHSIYFRKQGSVRNSDKFKGWLQSRSIQALSIGMIVVGIFGSNEPRLLLMTRYIPKAKEEGYDFGTTSNITQVCEAFVSGGRF